MKKIILNNTLINKVNGNKRGNFKEEKIGIQKRFHPLTLRFAAYVYMRVYFS